MNITRRQTCWTFWIFIMSCTVRRVHGYYCNLFGVKKQKKKTEIFLRSNGEYYYRGHHGVNTDVFNGSWRSRGLLKYNYVYAYLHLCTAKHVGIGDDYPIVIRIKTALLFVFRRENRTFSMFNNSTKLSKYDFFSIFSARKEANFYCFRPNSASQE